MRGRLLFPVACILNENGSTTKFISNNESLFLILFFIVLVRSEQDLVALTPIIQSPLRVRLGSLVISIVRECNERIFLWPQN